MCIRDSYKPAKIGSGKQNFVFGKRGFFGIDKKRRKDVFYRIEFGVISGICDSVAFIVILHFERTVGIEILPEIDIFSAAGGNIFLYKFVVEKRRLIKASPKMCIRDRLYAERKRKFDTAKIKEITQGNK